MADNNIERAVRTYITMCETLDGHEWKYQKNEENLSITCTAQGDDLPIDMTIMIDAKRSLIRLLSRLPFTVPEKKRLEFALAVSVVNYKLVDGSFDYNVKDGTLGFRLTSSFMESEMGPDVFTYALLCSCGTVDDYNDKFLMLSKGVVSLDQFLQSELS